MSSIIIANYLLARNATIQGVVGSRIYPVQAPQSVDGAYIVTNEVSSKDNALLEVPGKYYKDRVTVEAICPTPLEAINAGKAMMDCLDGVLSDSFTDFKDVTIRYADVSISGSNDAQTAFRVLKQFRVWWRYK